jgi:hypothetical protein
MNILRTEHLEQTPLIVHVFFEDDDSMPCRAYFRVLADVGVKGFALEMTACVEEITGTNAVRIAGSDRQDLVREAASYLSRLDEFAEW